MLLPSQSQCLKSEEPPDIETSILLTWHEPAGRPARKQRSNSKSLSDELNLYIGSYQLAIVLRLLAQ